ncbi:hypothetical protein TVAG_083140 [Trichomonas vaginalis G3]|uniref:Uncharacterized protein n=1 Tax=Trichomonas vaginalis (strain ATCC PRA-98 / G3) TaxID=412133 RepID=A2DM41_TRIV3|nr:hypothetical protein TVAG_083140 [Trichomonas vaginalis G3]|eukprot:XP_001579447.1 hypothetical protein [Trichomonas vaginalis G3]
MQKLIHHLHQVHQVKIPLHLLHQAQKANHHLPPPLHRKVKLPHLHLQRVKQLHPHPLQKVKQLHPHPLQRVKLPHHHPLQRVKQLHHHPLQRVKQLHHHPLQRVKLPHHQPLQRSETTSSSSSTESETTSSSSSTESETTSSSSSTERETTSSSTSTESETTSSSSPTESETTSSSISTSTSSESELSISTSTSSESESSISTSTSSESESSISTSTSSESESSISTSTSSESETSISTSTSSESETSISTSTSSESESSISTSTSSESESSISTSTSSESESSISTSTSSESETSISTSTSSESETSISTSTSSESETSISTSTSSESESTESTSSSSSSEFIYIPTPESTPKSTPASTPARSPYPTPLPITTPSPSPAPIEGNAVFCAYGGVSKYCPAGVTTVVLGEVENYVKSISISSDTRLLIYVAGVGTATLNLAKFTGYEINITGCDNNAITAKVTLPDTYSKLLFTDFILSLQTTSSTHALSCETIYLDNVTLSSTASEITLSATDIHSDIVSLEKTSTVTASDLFEVFDHTREPSSVPSISYKRIWFGYSIPRVEIKASKFHVPHSKLDVPFSSSVTEYKLNSPTTITVSASESSLRYILEDSNPTMTALFTKPSTLTIEGNTPLILQTTDIVNLKPQQETSKLLIMSGSKIKIAATDVKKLNMANTLESKIYIPADTTYNNVDANVSSVSIYNNDDLITALSDFTENNNKVYLENNNKRIQLKVNIDGTGMTTSPIGVKIEDGTTTIINVTNADDKVELTINYNSTDASVQVNGNVQLVSEEGENVEASQFSLSSDKKKNIGLIIGIVIACLVFIVIIILIIIFLTPVGDKLNVTTYGPFAGEASESETTPDILKPTFDELMTNPNAMKVYQFQNEDETGNPFDDNNAEESGFFTGQNNNTGFEGSNNNNSADNDKKFYWNGNFW